MPILSQPFNETKRSAYLSRGARGRVHEALAGVAGLAGCGLVSGSRGASRDVWLCL
ncbi:hypothetical protein [Mobiluncus mulieris]|uniref:Uncharacterized protein n=1 Tax=Mobiluncus mulieris TaxID=2052 RepID=A0A7Y0UVW3_9ACTO|nr:hypothetical protein [Mobiluncus mulieris]NMX04479.1 hypothetical protein [Mobiluncus mulieris]